MLQMLYQNRETGVIFDISTLVVDIEYTTDLNNQPGKLTFTVVEDPNKNLVLASGSIISLMIDGTKIFYGYDFTGSTDESGDYKITAYDQLRYLANKDTLLLHNQSASDFFEYICAKEGLTYRVDAPSNTILQDYFFDKSSYNEMIQEAVKKANLTDKDYYFVFDDFGTLVFSSLKKRKTNLVLGDKSLVYSFKYERSIDRDVYNEIKIIRDNEKTEKRDVWITLNSDRIKTWGKLRMLVEAQQEQTEAQIKEMGENLLKAYGDEKQTMSFSALGVLGLIAGDGFRIRLSNLGIDRDMWTTAVSHKWNGNHHDMEMSVYV